MSKVMVIVIKQKVSLMSKVMVIVIKQKVLIFIPENIHCNEI